MVRLLCILLTVLGLSACGMGGEPAGSGLPPAQETVPEQTADQSHPFSNDTSGQGEPH